MKKVSCSVLLLHFNQNYEIALALEGFLNQTENLNDFEIIIVDDGSTESILDIVNLYKLKGLNIVLLEVPHTGSRAENRARAVSASCGEIIIFMDSDMIPGRNFIEKHKINISRRKNCVSLGYRKLLDPFDKNFINTDTIRNHFNIIESYSCELDERIPLILAHERTNTDISKAWYISYSHNLALSRKLYNSIQGFDEGFGKGWGVEDIDIGYQLFNVGAEFIYDSEICSYHIAHGRAGNKSEDYYINLKYFYHSQF